MRDECKAAVTAAAKALGRAAPTESQLRAIDEQLSASMRQIAKRDPADGTR